MSFLRSSKELNRSNGIAKSDLKVENVKSSGLTKESSDDSSSDSDV